MVRPGRIGGDRISRVQEGSDVTAELFFAAISRHLMG